MIRQIIKISVFSFLTFSFGIAGVIFCHAQTKRNKTKKPVAVQQQKIKSGKQTESETDEKFEACLASSGTPKPDTGLELLKAKRPEPNNSCAISTSIIYQPELVYPPAARAVRASGLVNIDTIIDEEGNVIWAKVADGNPLLWATSMRTLCQTRFKPIVDVNGEGLKVNGWMTYNFAPDK
jgi:outer membrane biosynthesis protein TonB